MKTIKEQIEERIKEIERKAEAIKLAIKEIKEKQELLYDNLTDIYNLAKEIEEIADGILNYLVKF